MEPLKLNSLTILPAGIINMIVGYLPSNDRLILRSVSRLFGTFVPRPTLTGLLDLELEEWAREKCLLTCGGCLRLRPESKFHKLMLSYQDWYAEERDYKYKQPKAFNMSGSLAGRRGRNAKWRFCNVCGARPLPGDFRYELGVYWVDENGCEMVRCKICKEDRETPKEYRSGICVACATWEDQWLGRRLQGGSDQPSKEGQGETPQKPSLQLIAMPQKLILQIIDYAGPCGRLALRCTNRFLRNVIRPPSQKELLAAETEDFAVAGELYACNGCLRLRREWKFDRRMIWKCADPWEYEIFDDGMKRAGERAHERFCNECGARDLPGDFRYPLGGSWTHGEEKQEPGHCNKCDGAIGKTVEYVRCGYCKKVEKLPHCYPGMGSCETCCETYYGTQQSSPTVEEESGPSKLMSLLDLSQNALSTVVSYIDVGDRMRLRCASRFFYELIPESTHNDILAAELEEWAIAKDIFACGGCGRLRHRAEFGYRLVCEPGGGKRKKYCSFNGWRALYHGGPEAEKRYCDDCGKRDLPGEFRYPSGCHWLFDDKEFDRAEEFVRCKVCRKVTRPQDGTYNGHGVGWRCNIECHMTRKYSSSALDRSIPTDMWKLKEHFGRPLITTIPAELILNITNNLRLVEVMLLRGVSHFFHNTIPSPTHQQLLEAETEKWAGINGLLTCGGCLRLRDEGEFSHKFMMPGIGRNQLFYSGFLSGEVKAAQRFCHECGVRPLPGDFRYWRGSHYDDKHGKNGLMVRCKRCGMDRPAPQRRRNDNSAKYSEAGLCEPCVVQEKGRGFLKIMPKRTWQLSKLEGISTDLTKRIMGNLEFPDRMALRLVSWNMNFGVPPLTRHHELVSAEQEEWAVESRVLTCGGCIRLRHESKFAPEMIMKSQTGHQDFGMHRGGKKAHLRFCLGCAATDLAEKSRIRLRDRRYAQSDRFDLDGLFGSPVIAQ